MVIYQESLVICIELSTKIWFDLFKYGHLWVVDGGLMVDWFDRLVLDLVTFSNLLHPMILRKPPVEPLGSLGKLPW